MCVNKALLCFLVRVDAIRTLSGIASLAVQHTVFVFSENRFDPDSLTLSPTYPINVKKIMQRNAIEKQQQEDAKVFGPNV